MRGVLCGWLGEHIWLFGWHKIGSRAKIGEAVPLGPIVTGLLLGPCIDTRGGGLTSHTSASDSRLALPGCLRR